jgi:hypothetical protein
LKTLLNDMETEEILYCLLTDQITYDDLVVLDMLQLFELEDEMMNIVAVSHADNNPDLVVWNQTLQ